MASTAKASDQVKQIRANVAVSNHRFFNMIADGVIRSLEGKVPGIKLVRTAGSITKNGGTIVVTGQMPVASEEEKEKAETDVRQAIDALKNPADLLSTIR